LRVEEFLDVTQTESSPGREGVLDLIHSELRMRREDGESPTLEEYGARFPAYAEELGRLFAVDSLVRTTSDVSEIAIAAPNTTVDFPPEDATLPGSQGPSRRRVGDRFSTDLPGYEILEVLGRGGMGIVYKARQHGLNRLVAVKMILSGGHAGEEELARFHTEGEAVARLQHPHIVQIYEVGNHNDLPYFSLEYCAGGSLAKKIDGTPRTPDEAARLVETLARAIHAAHDQNVIHRDLKPANILFGADGQPKITDFGLAKKMDDAGHTRSGAVVGTPSYMAPEQASGKIHEIGRGTDVYALGAILYELLTGRPPFKAATGLETVMQVIHQEPVPPTQLQPKIARDLETICLKCLQKAPERRYGTAKEFAEDLRRFLAREPIAARPVGRWERSWRWCRRNRMVASLLASMAGLLIVGSSVGWYLAWEANESRRVANQRADEAKYHAKIAQDREIEARNETKRADQNAAQALRESAKAVAEAEKARNESERANQVARFLVGLFDAADPIGLTGYAFGPDPARGSKVTAKELLDQGVKKIRGDLKEQPEVRAAILTTIGGVYRSMGLHKEARKLLAEGLELRIKTFGAESLEVAQSYFELGWLAQHEGELHEALEYYEKVIAAAEQKPGTEDLVSRCRFNMAWALAWHHADAASEKMFEGVLAERRKRLGEDHYEVAIAKGGLASIYLQNGKQLPAVPLILSALNSFKKHHGEESIATACVMSQNAIVAVALGNMKEGEENLIGAVDLARKQLGDNHPYIAWGYGVIAELMLRMDRPKESERYYKQALDVCRQSLGMEHPMVLRGINPYANLLAKRGKFAEACGLYQSALASQEKNRGKAHPIRVETLYYYAGFLLSHGKRAEAEALLKQGVELGRAIPKGSCPMFPPALSNLALLVRDRNPSLAAELFEEAVQQWPAHRNRTAKLEVEARTHLAITLRRLGQHARSAKVLEGADRLVKTEPGVAKQWVSQIERMRATLPSLLNLEAARHAGQAALAISPCGAETWVLLADELAPAGAAEHAPAFREARVGSLMNGELRPDDGFDPRGATSHCQFYRIALKKDCVYTMTLRSKQFDSFLRLEEMDGRILRSDDDGGGGLDSRIVYTAERSAEHRIMVSTFEPFQVGEYTLEVREALPLATGMVVLKDLGRTNADDPRDRVRPKSPHRVVELKMKAGKTYWIDLRSKEFDPYLRLEDSARKQLAFDDDGGGGLNSRLFFRAPADGVYRLVITSFDAKAGRYELEVREGK